ncbi:MAG TPA: Gfo/Idh/MocA family oxidoreductase [Vicinamibacteria bacterium]|nr:Gfo/Idh/MocA family oxidoreductase [Vicinamibacteria bacterium]
MKIGIVGAGIWGSNHALALSSHPPGELTMICDSDGARARRLAEKHGCAWTTSLDELADSDVQAVTVATPDHLHAAPTLRMLAAAKHVLVEKPLATTVTEARKMVEAAESAGVKFMVDFHARWHPLFMGAKGYAESGQLGDPVVAYARLSNTLYVPTEMLRWSGNSGPEWFLFPHVMDVVRWILGSEPVEVFARGHRGVLEKRGLDCWDAIQALVEFENGAICTFETSWVLPSSYTNVVDNRLSLVGSKGGLEIKNEPALWAFTDRFHTPFSSESVTRYGKAWGFQYESIRYFVDCVANDVTPEAGGRDGLVATAMIEASLKSLRERRPVRMEELLR